MKVCISISRVRWYCKSKFSTFSIIINSWWWRIEGGLHHYFIRLNNQCRSKVGSDHFASQKLRHVTQWTILDQECANTIAMVTTTLGMLHCFRFFKSLKFSNLMFILQLFYPPKYISMQSMEEYRLSTPCHITALWSFGGLLDI